MSTELVRDHKGQLHLYSDNRPVHGAVVNGISTQPDGAQHAVVLVAMASLSVKEMDNVVPFPLRAPVVVVGER